MMEVFVAEFIWLGKPFVWRQYFRLDVLYVFRNESRLVASPRKFQNVKKLNITEIERDKLIGCFDNSRFNISFRYETR